MTNINETFNQKENDAVAHQNAETQASPNQNEGVSGKIPEKDTNAEIGAPQSHFSRTVPYGALHAEREEHKKTKAILEQLRAQHTQKLTDEQEKPEETEETEENHLWQAWQQSCAASKAELPDFDGALAFLAKTRERQLAALGTIDERFQDESNRTRQLQEEWQDLVKTSLEHGENPARVIYQLAQAHGYESRHDGNNCVIARLKGLDEAQKAARTLAATHGSEAGDPLLLESLANLSEAEFARWYENNPDSFRRLFAG